VSTSDAYLCVCVFVLVCVCVCVCVCVFVCVCVCFMFMQAMWLFLLVSVIPNRKSIRCLVISARKTTFLLPNHFSPLCVRARNRECVVVEVCGSVLALVELFAVAHGRCIDDALPKLYGKVLVLGAGDTAMDCATSSLRLVCVWVLEGC